MDILLQFISGFGSDFTIIMEVIVFFYFVYYFMLFCFANFFSFLVSFLLAEDSIEDDGSESGETDEDSDISMATNDISDCFFQFVPVNPRFQDCWEEETQEDAEGFWIDQEIFQRVVPASALEAVELETVESSVPEVSVLTPLPLQEASSDNGEPAEEVRALTPLPLQTPSSYPVEEAMKQKKKGSFRKRMSALFCCYPCKVKKKNRYD